VNDCGTNNDKPPEVQECIYEPTCYDSAQNGDETGMDCGGSICTPCPGCENGIQDDNEQGVDCGGDCRPCDSCFNGIQDYEETDIDCGGPYCDACEERKPGLIEYPSIICEKEYNPLKNDARWFLLIVLSLAVIRAYLYRKELRLIRKDQLLDEFKRAEKYYRKRREMVLFILIVIVLTFLSYEYYYLFLLCNAGKQHLWAFLLLLLIVPWLIYSILRVLTYSDNRKLALLKEKLKTHEEQLEDLLVFENEQLVQIEQDIASRIEGVATNLQLVEDLNRLPEIKSIYNDIITLYYEYHKNKTPTGIERDLCEKTYAVETNEEFKKLAAEYPEIGVIYQKLRLLYTHYENKQKLYDELAKLSEARAQKEAAGPTPMQEEDKENDRFDKPEQAAEGKVDGKAEEKKQ